MPNLAKFRDYSRLFLAGVALALLGAADAAAGCNTKLRHEAEVSAPNIADWDDYNFAAKRYAACDTATAPDASLEATYRAKTTLLLNTHQDDFYRFIAFNRKDASIGDFLVRHVDPAMPAEKAAQVRSFVSSRCVIRPSNICARIVEALPN